MVATWSTTSVKFWTDDIRWGSALEPVESPGAFLLRHRLAVIDPETRQAITQIKVGEQTGVAGNTIGALENDRIENPTKKVVRRLAIFYGFTVEEFEDTQTAYRRWERSQRLLDGESIAIPKVPVVDDIVQAMKVMAERYEDESGLAPVRIIMQAVQHMDKDTLEKAARTLANFEMDIPGRDDLAQDEDAV